MQAIIEFVSRHGYGVLIVWVFAEQIGLPIPSIPILLAAGALAGAGRMSLGGALLCAVAAALIADSLWFQLGRVRGFQVLRWLCRVSLEPDSCVRRTEGVFSRQGARVLLVAKFIPALNTVSPPLAGVVGMRPRRFLFFDALGTVLWAGTFLGLGYAFRGEIESLAARAESMGGSALVLLGGAFGAYIAYKFISRQRLLRELRIARIDVDDLKARLDSGESLVIVDLRQSLAVEADPETIPGAFRMDADDLPRHIGSLPRDAEVILFCT
jgi:membrane protein DedA with SNARE-associated domain